MKLIFILISILTSSFVFSQDIAYVDQTKFKANILYVNGKPFSGTLYSTEDNVSNQCTCLLQASYLNGKLNGVKSEYFKNGNLKFRAKFENGSLIGKAKVFDSQGKLILKPNVIAQIIEEKENASPEVIDNWIVKAEKYYRLNDFVHAFEFYLKAAEQNNAIAQNMIGVMHEKGQSVRKDVIKAKKWYQESSNQNNSDAQMNLSYLYYSAPYGINKDLIVAEDLLNKSANSGNSKAQYLLSILYANVDGKGFIKNLEKATTWMKKAADQNYPNSNNELAALYFQQEKYNKAITYYTKSANANNPRSQFVLGAMYRKGIGTKKSRKNAKKWFKLACKNNYKEACDEIKKMNAFGNSLLNSVNKSLNKRN